MRLPRRDRRPSAAAARALALPISELAVRAVSRFGVRFAGRTWRVGHALVLTLGVGLGVDLSVPRLVAGRERTQVALSIDSCVAVEPDQVRHLLALELGEPLCTGETPTGATRATVTCHRNGEPALREVPPLPPTLLTSAPPLPPTSPLPSAPLASAPPLSQASPRPQAPLLTPSPPPASGYLVELRVDDAVTGKSLWRSIELQPADPSVRARLLALALAELLFASWAELLVTPQPAVPAAAPPASAATRRATSVQLARKLPRPLPLLGVQLSALGAVFGQLGEPALAFGGGVRVTGDHGYHLGWDADVLIHHGETATTLGIVTRDLFSTRAALLFHHRVPYLTLRAGVGGRLGAARLAGAATDPKAVLAATVWGPWGGPLLTLGLSSAAARVRLDMSVEAGYVIDPVAARVGGVRTVAVEGTWFGIQLGLGGLVR